MRQPQPWLGTFLGIGVGLMMILAVFVDDGGLSTWVRLGLVLRLPATGRVGPLSWTTYSINVGNRRTPTVITLRCR